MRHLRFLLSMIISLTFVLSSHAGLVVSLGLQGGGGGALVKDQITNLNTSGTSENENVKSNGWAANAKGELVFNLGKLRMGYQFMYNYSTSPSATNTEATTSLKSLTTVINSSNSTTFGNYFLLELAVVDKPKFALVPGTMIGGYTGFQTQLGSDSKIKIPTLANHRFSVGAELNIEFKMKAASIVMGPNYYFYKMRDKATNTNKDYQNLIGANAGVRINLKKTAKK